jgi:myo-inositol-1-phosphate synthase
MKTTVAPSKHILNYIIIYLTLFPEYFQNLILENLFQIRQHKTGGCSKTAIIMKATIRNDGMQMRIKVYSKVTIDYVPSLGDRKTAWDFIHFKGLLNTPMSLPFTWQGCDSALAAPLVLDLARFGILAMQRG